MAETKVGGGRITEVVLKPQVVVRGTNKELALNLHEQAHQMCFIANSVNFPVHCEAAIATYMAYPTANSDSL